MDVLPLIERGFNWEHFFRFLEMHLKPQGLPEPPERRRKVWRSWDSHSVSR
jgi:hypothetical protein